MAPRLLILGDARDFHVGGAFLSAARSLDVPVEICDVRNAQSTDLLNKFAWRFFDRMPWNIRRYERDVVNTVRRFSPQVVLATGLCPIRKRIVDTIKAMGAVIVNFMTDDPWSASNHTRWILKALPSYDWVFTPRTANIQDLLDLGCNKVEYLPFGFNPDIHFPVTTKTDGELQSDSDIVFIGGADQSRAKFIHAVSNNGVKIVAFGGYWDRYPHPNLSIGGNVSPQVLREALARTKLTIIINRHSNRDGHVMRTFESAASQRFMVLEDSNEHRTIFKNVLSHVRFFDSLESLQAVCHSVLELPAHEREQAASAVYEDLIGCGFNRYSDRLKFISDKASRK